MQPNNKHPKQHFTRDKQHLRANGFALLPLALRPCLSKVHRSTFSLRYPKPSPTASHAQYLNRKFFLANGIAATSVVFTILALSSRPLPASAASITLTIPEAITLTVLPNQSDTLATSPGSKLAVSTDSPAGYTLSLKGQSDDNALTNNSHKLNSIPSKKTADDFPINSWGYRLSGPNLVPDFSNGTFQPGPTTSSTILGKTASATDDADHYTFTIGAKVNNSLPSGIYRSAFEFTAAANAASYTVNYNGNDGGQKDVTDIPDQSTGTTYGAAVELSSTAPKRGGYKFLGWCDQTPTSTQGLDSCNGTAYQPSASWDLTQATNELDLYAMWEPLLTSIVEGISGDITFKAGEGIDLIMVADSQARIYKAAENSNLLTVDTTTKWWPYYAIKDTDVTLKNEEVGTKLLITVVPQKDHKLLSWTKKTNNGSVTWIANGINGTYPSMQTTSKADCLNSGEEGINVTDTRNNVSYTVGKFGEKCWMYSNLRLEGETQLSSTNSDIKDNETFILPASATSESWEDKYLGKVMIGCKGEAGTDVKPFDAYSQDKTNRTCDNINNTITITEYYYNWYAATANDEQGDNPKNPAVPGDTDMTTTEIENLDKKSKGSICPKGWRLLEEKEPGSGSLVTTTEEIEALAIAQNTSENNNAGRLATSGHFWANHQHIVGVFGTINSSSRSSDTFVSRLYTNASTSQNNRNNKFDGISVRCLLREE